MKISITKYGYIIDKENGEYDLNSNFERLVNQFYKLLLNNVGKYKKNYKLKPIDFMIFVASKDKNGTITHSHVHSVANIPDVLKDFFDEKLNLVAYLKLKYTWRHLVYKEFQLKGNLHIKKQDKNYRETAKYFMKNAEDENYLGRFKFTKDFLSERDIEKWKMS